MDCSPPGSSVHGILQARILEWVAISFFTGSSQPRNQTCVFCIGRCILYRWATWKAHMLYKQAYIHPQASLAALVVKHLPASTGDIRDVGSIPGLLCPPPGNLPNPGIKPRSSALQTYSLPSEPPGNQVINIWSFALSCLKSEEFKIKSWDLFHTYTG